MDVVRSNIEGIGGSIDLRSVKGQGSTVRIKIPLTLAILSALIVGVGEQRFAIPQIGVVELVRIGDENRSLVQSVGGAPVFRLRETLLPLVYLGDALRLPTAEGADHSIVVCHVGGHRFGVVVEQILDTQEIVVKPLGRMVKSIPFFSGTTILGDGGVIMILDVPGIAALTHVDGSAGAARMSSAGAVAEARDADESRVSLVVFSSGGEARQAVPLALVSRLEKIAAGEIEYADGRWLVQYRGGLLPLVPASPTMEMRALPERPVIVFSDGEHSMGLAVEEIHDIIEEELRIETQSTSPGVLGAAVIAGRSTEIVDIHHFLRTTSAAWFRRRAETADHPRVLIVEDSSFFRNVVGPPLRAARYDVFTAGDGQEALERLERGEQFDLILSDIDMPRIDGWELARRLREHPEWRGTPILALTGRTGDADRRRAAELGFRAFLPKFDRDTVLTAVQNAIAHRSEALV
jgi:two-component system, chemotaxis family, sensor kinase CheA